MVNPQSDAELTKVIEFYRESIKSVRGAALVLAELQENFPEKYKLLIGARNDPLSILDQFPDLTEEQKDYVILFFTKLSIIAEKSSNIFDLSLDEQKKLAEEIDAFDKQMLDRITILRDKHEPAPTK